MPRLPPDSVAMKGHAIAPVPVGGDRDLAQASAVTGGERLGHLQLADNPGRNEPGTGEINYPFLFDVIDRLGYDGWIGCEYKPKGKIEEGLGWFTKG